MIELYHTKPCADHLDAVQAEGRIVMEAFSIDYIERVLGSLHFKVVSIGDPKVLICKRCDCLLFVKADGHFNISEVSSEEKLAHIIHEINSVKDHCS